MPNGPKYAPNCMTRCHSCGATITWRGSWHSQPKCKCQRKLKTRAKKLFKVPHVPS